MQFFAPGKHPGKTAEKGPFLRPGSGFLFFTPL
jgi:hypothetical protein